MEDNSYVDVRNLCVKFLPEQLTDALEEKISTFARLKCITDVIVTKEGFGLFCGNGKKIRLNSGMETLRKDMGLELPPTRVRDFDPLPNPFFVQQLGPDFQDDDLFFQLRKKITRSLVKSAVEQMQARTKNQTIMSKSTKELVETGVIPITQAATVDMAKEYMVSREDRMDKDLVGDFSYAFQKRTKNVSTGEWEPLTDRPPYEVTLSSFPEEEKLKNYWIYSKQSSHGKSFFCAEFTKKYNACMVRDIQNWCDVNSSAQFLIFDEFNSRRHLDWQQLKALTASNGVQGGLRRKSFGASYVPRSDVQVIILSNQSPYDVLGEWDAKRQMRVMAEEDCEQLEDRFFIHRLDGNAHDDKIHHTHPSRWTRAQYLNEVVIAMEPSLWRLLRGTKNSLMLRGHMVDKVACLLVSRVIESNANDVTEAEDLLDDIARALILFALRNPISILSDDTVKKLDPNPISTVLDDTIKQQSDWLTEEIVTKEESFAVLTLVKKSNKWLNAMQIVVDPLCHHRKNWRLMLEKSQLKMLEHSPPPKRMKFFHPYDEEDQDVDVKLASGSLACLLRLL